MEAVRIVFEVRQIDGATVIYVTTDLDMASRDAFTSTVAMAAEGHRRVVISLEQCSYCDSTALSVLARTKKHIGARLQIVIPLGHPVRRIFELMKVTDYFRLLPSVDEALAAP